MPFRPNADVTREIHLWSAFGGAGPIHAAALAEEMEISPVLVPVFPGLFSALGLLLADYRHDYIRSIVTPLDAIDPGRILRLYEEMQQSRARHHATRGSPSEGVRFEPYVDLKYGYQLQELTVPFPHDDSSVAYWRTWQRSFVPPMSRRLVTIQTIRSKS